MNFKLKRMKTSKLNKLGHLPQKTDYKKPRIKKFSDNKDTNSKISSVYDQINQTKTIEIEYLKNNGLMYSNILKFR